MFLVIKHYLNPNSGVQIKVSELTNLKRETADILSNYIVESLKEHKLSDKIITYPGDNKINYNLILEMFCKKGTKMVFQFSII